VARSIPRCCLVVDVLRLHLLISNPPFVIIRSIKPPVPAFSYKT
jgi:hypothetical protein